MIDLDVGGACPRQQLTCALSQTLGLPKNPGAGTDALTIGTMDYPSEPALEMVARARCRPGKTPCWPCSPMTRPASAAASP